MSEDNTKEDGETVRLLPRRKFFQFAGAAVGSSVLPDIALAADSQTKDHSGPLDQNTPIEVRARAAKAALKNKPGTVGVILGTAGGPEIGLSRRETSVAMVHGDAVYVLDFGLGTINQFARVGLEFPRVRSLFITHHHPDHNVEYGPFLLIGWVHGLKQDIKAYGPPPLMQMTRDYLNSQAITFKFWAEDFGMKALEMIDVHELPEPGFVMKDENVSVSSTLVQHPPVKPAYGYRFDFKDRSIVFSGDTIPLESVARMATGADVLVHEVMDVAAAERLARYMQAQDISTYKRVMHHMLADHSPAVEVGRIAQEAGVKELILYHLTPAFPNVPADVWKELASRHFKGNIKVGFDLMTF